MILEDLTKLKNLKEMVDYAAENFGDVDFMQYKTENGVESKTFADFKKSTESYSRMLVDRFPEGVHSAIIGPTSYEWVTAFFGTANSSNVSVPLATAETDDMNCKLIEFADVNVLVFDRKHINLYKLVKERNKNIKMFVSIDNSSESDDVENIADLLCEYEGEYSNDPDGDAMCTINFTSGTTGFPKGVMQSHKNLVFSAASVHAACPTKKMFCCLPINHSFCFTANITKSIVRGKTVCVNDNIANIVQDIQLYKPDSIIAVPQIVKKLMFAAIRYAKTKPELPQKTAVKNFFGGNIMDMISGGAPLEADLNAKFNEAGVLILNGYGMTECSPIISNNSVYFYRHGSVGKPIPCMEIKIRKGEILAKGPNVMLGYYKNPEATKEAFTEDGFFHTGDLGYLDDDGYLYITGRSKNLILLDNGENVSAEMLEERFSKEEIVSEVVCHGDNGAVCAEMYLDQGYIKEHNIEDVDKVVVEMLSRINQNLASYQRITAYNLRDIPFERTALQKIKRSSLMGKKKRTIVAPKTPAEKKVCNCVKELLLMNEISVSDNFFALGGDSLSALELAVSLNVKPQLVYDNPFLGLLAKAIDEEKSRNQSEETDFNALISSTKLPDAKMPEYKCALLTGSTGFLGVHILKELVDRKIKVYCLVRSVERLNSKIDFYFDDIDRDYIVPIDGNIENRRLGLDKETYKNLTDEVDVVFHIAANVHHAGDYSDLERTNVTGTKNVIAFAKDADAVLQHTSTVSLHGAGTVIEKYKNAEFDENILDIGQHHWDNVYIHSKYCAEQEVLLARKEGLKANIYRIGNLTWRAADGKFQKNSEDNGFLSRIHAILKLGLFNDSMNKYPMDLTAVDECAKGYVSLAMSGSVNEIYHMYNPNYLETQELFRLLDKPYRRASSAETVETVMANADDRDIHVYLFYLIISGRSSNVEMKNSYTVEKLSQLGFEWSLPDKRYLTVSPDSSCPNGHCLNYAPYEVNPMRKTGGSMSPIQKLTLGVLRDANLIESKVMSGENALEELSAHIKASKLSKPLVVAFAGALNNEKINSFVSSFGTDVPVFDSILAEPTTDDTNNALAIYDKNNCDCVVAIGGGSVLDTSKFIALQAANKGEYIDDICKIDTYANPCVPFFAVPTTSGTGSEVTVYAVITDTEENKKKPFISDRFQPHAIALVPSLTASVPKMSTAFTGIDALSHAVEAYVSQFAPSFPEDRDLAPVAVKKVFESLVTAQNEPNNLKAREAMQQASFEAGLSFRTIGTGYIHAIAHRLGEFCHLPHGMAIAAAFVPVLKAYMPYGANELSKLAVYCGFGDENNSAEKNADLFIEKVDSLIKELGIDFSSLSYADEDFQDIIERAQDEAKLVGYPRPFSDEEVGEIIKTIFA